MTLPADLFPEQARAGVLIRHALLIAEGMNEDDAQALTEVVLLAVAAAGMEIRTVPRHLTPTSEFHRP